MCTHSFQWHCYAPQDCCSSSTKQTNHFKLSFLTSSFFLFSYNIQCLAKIILPRVKTDGTGQQIFCAVLANLAQHPALLSALHLSLQRHYWGEAKQDLCITFCNLIEINTMPSSTNMRLILSVKQHNVIFMWWKLS